MRRSFIFYTIH